MYLRTLRPHEIRTNHADRRAHSLFRRRLLTETAPRSEEVRPVKTMVVVAGGSPHVRVFPGKVEASKKVELAFQVPGLLIKLPVKEGSGLPKAR